MPRANRVKDEAQCPGSFAEELVGLGHVSTPRQSVLRHPQTAARYSTINCTCCWPRYSLMSSR